MFVYRERMRAGLLLDTQSGQKNQFVGSRLQDAGFSRDIQSLFWADILDLIKANDKYKLIVHFFKFRGVLSRASAEISRVCLLMSGNKKKQEQEAS